MNNRNSFLDNVGGYGATSALGGGTDNVTLNLRWLSDTTSQNGVNAQSIPDTLNSVYGKSTMSGSVPTETSINGVQSDGTGLSSLGEYGKVASQWAQPIGLGLGAYSTFFGQGKTAFDKNMKLLDQQIAGNKDKLARRSALNAAWARTEEAR